MVGSAKRAVGGPVNCARDLTIPSRHAGTIVRRSYSLGKRTAGGDAPNARIWSNWVLDATISRMFFRFLLSEGMYTNATWLPAADAVMNFATPAARRGRLVPASSGKKRDFSGLDTCGRWRNVTIMSGYVSGVPVNARSAKSGCRGLSSSVRIVTLELVRLAGTIGGRILRLC